MPYRDKSVIVGSWPDVGENQDQINFERIQTGLAALRVLADQLETTSLWIVTNGRDSITIVEPLREAVEAMLGDGAATRLKRGEAVQWGDYTVQQSTERNLTRDTVGGAILAVFIDDKALEFLDRIYRRNSLVVVDFMDTAAEWKVRNNPIDLLADDEDDEE